MPVSLTEQAFAGSHLSTMPFLTKLPHFAQQPDAQIAAQTGHLQLDKAIVTREVGFYALSIVLLYYALRDRELAEDGSYHIFISFADACILFAGYIAYVLVCANMDRIVALFSSTSDPLASEESKKKSYGAVDGTVTVSADRHFELLPSCFIIYLTLRKCI